jgi:hypothetical protein
MNQLERERWERSFENRERITASYREAHCCCPICGNREIYQTTAGGIYAPDTNKALCLSCRWSGIVDELVSVHRHSEEKDIEDWQQETNDEGSASG